MSYTNEQKELIDELVIAKREYAVAKAVETDLDRQLIAASQRAVEAGNRVTAAETALNDAIEDGKFGFAQTEGGDGDTGAQA